MAAQRSPLIYGRMKLSVTKAEGKQLAAWGGRVALEEDPTLTHVSTEYAIELAVKDILARGLWPARQSCGLSGKPER